ncbi:MAG: MATE family efflux transporter [Gammaproteobacteria bacterium]|jgi:putative MATE family efflux protein|nr:MATE family efflux transporter [Chromatiales bacterium]MDP7154574.1 MATE family efflux transporter [Gammaproteobacteria bacterium]MDP7419156.1 MATE family efflux transporter [Gammaproteobacteria bacterium]MDP7659671.1 MATE family efflux transporter [Gammaproteobacteria bacterium]
MTQKKSKKGGRNLTQGPIGGTIRSLMMPMLVGMVAMLSYNIADTYFVGQLGTMELAAISFTFPVSFIVGIVTLGLGIGTASVCSRLFGAKKFADVERVAIHAMLLGIVAGLIVIAIGLLTIDPLFTLLGADDTTLPVIRRYMKIYYWGGIFLVVPMISNSVLRASGNAKTPAMIMTVSALFNVILDPIMIFGLFGFPRLEVEGAAVATVVSNIGTLVASILAVTYKQHLITFRHLWPRKIIDSWRRILHVGLPSTASSLIAPITTAFITYQIAQFGQEAVAGFGVASRVEGFVLMAIMALSSAVTPFVGQNFGGQQYKRVKQGVRWCYRFSLIYGLTVTVILAMISGYIAEFFTDDPQAIATAQLHLTIVPISYLGLGMAMTANSAFNAIGKPMPAMFVSLIRTILVYAPLAFLLAKLFGLTGIFAAACTANLVAGGLGRIWFRFTYVQTVTEDKAVLKT